MRMEAEAKERLSAACSFSSTTSSITSSTTTCSFLPNCPTTTCSFTNSVIHCQGEGRPSHDQARDGHENTGLPHLGPHISDHPPSYPRGGNAFLSAVFLLLLLLPAGLAQQNLIPEQGDPPLNNITNLLIVILSLLYKGAYTAEHCWRGGSKCDFVTIQPLFHSSSLSPTTSTTYFPNSTHPDHARSPMFPNSSHEVAKILPQRPQFVFRGIAMTVMTMKMIKIFVLRSRENIPRVSSSGHDVHPTKPTRVDDRV